MIPFNPILAGVILVLVGSLVGLVYVLQTTQVMVP